MRFDPWLENWVPHTARQLSLHTQLLSPRALEPMYCNKREPTQQRELRESLHVNQDRAGKIKWRKKEKWSNLNSRDKTDWRMNEQSLRILWNHNKDSTLASLESWKGRRKKAGLKATWRNSGWKLSNLAGGANLLIREADWIPNRIDPKKSTVHYN